MMICREISGLQTLRLSFRGLLNSIVWRLHNGGTRHTFEVADEGIPVFTIGGWTIKDRFLIDGTIGGSENDATYQKRVNLNDAFVCFAKALKGKGVTKLEWGYLRGDSEFHKVLIDNGAVKTGERPHLRIHFDFSDHVAYFASLGKHAKQNVRTAYNRLARDGHTYSLEAYSANAFGLPLFDGGGGIIV